MGKKAIPVKIELMSGDVCVETVLSKYWKRDKDGNPLTNTRKIVAGPLQPGTTITHATVDGRRLDFKPLTKVPVAGFDDHSVEITCCIDSESAFL